jgi:AcrR family transcriptional regulator
VSELSGVSQGAQSYHFPQRVDLVTAAVEHMADTRIAELRELAADLPADPRDRVVVLLDLLWSDFSSRTFMVFVKLWVAAADDARLYERLVPVERRLAVAMGSLVSELAGDVLRQTPDWERRRRLVIAALRGLALTQGFEPRGRRRRDPWPDLRPILLEVMAPR